jgi:folate-dependent tRNA-U54 methylase TrmFO/GidA
MGTELATGVKVFSTTLARDREVLGETITRWITEHPDVEILEKQVRQSSDREFHCLSVTLFYRDRRRE